MSIIGSLFKAIFGGAPTVSSSAVNATTEGQKQANAARASLYETQGGSSGEELSTDQVQRRQTLFGN